MTTQSVNDTAAQKPRLAVIPADGSVLDDLLTRLQAAKAAQAEAADLVHGLTAQIKDALQMEHPAVRAFDIAGSPRRPAMTLNWVESPHLNTKRLKTENPRLYVEYVEFTGKWVLAPARKAA